MDVVMLKPVSPAPYISLVVRRSGGLCSDIHAPLPVLPLQEAGLAENIPSFNGSYVDFGLKPNSPAVDAGAPGTDVKCHHTAGGRASDLGAIELGETWKFPRPGPRWAVGKKTPWRPELPPSLHPRWVGLDRQ